jgi:hypothetical protein
MEPGNRSGMSRATISPTSAADSAQLDKGARNCSVAASHDRHSRGMARTYGFSP